MPAPSLVSRLPKPGEPKLSTDAILDRFVGWAVESGLELYPHQEEAILELLQGKHVVLATPTGSGKSLVATALHFQALCQGRSSFYTCPIKALVNEKFFALCELFGAENVGMMTGDAAINRKAPILCCTAEILSNLCVREARQFADTVVMDEFHYYGDRERGVAWQVPLITLEQTQYLLMSATLGELTDITEALTERTGREVAQVRSATRPVPLDFSYSEVPLHETVRDSLQTNKAPIYLVNFTQRSAAEQAQNLMSIDVCTKEEKEKLKEALQGFRFDSPFGKELRRLLLHGLGLHHAGLLPKYRRLVERLAQAGMLKVISGTDTLGVGVNVPIRTVLFTQLCKFDGEKTVILAVRDFQQIAGRAGRRGYDTQGYVVAQAPAHVIENLKLQQKKASGKNVVMQKPPTKGFVHWDKATFERLQSRPPESLESRFSISHGLMLNLLQAGQETREGGYRRLVKLVDRSHTRTVQKVSLLKHAALLFRALRTAGIVTVEARTPTAPAFVQVAPGLQKEFSLNQTLSLFLVEVLPKLDKASESYAPDVLSVVESILENPDVVLRQQLDALKGQKIAEWKAQGMEYDERMVELEKLEWPKPLATLLYGTFDDFSARHPWVGRENVRPKSVARELFEKAATFNDYVKDYGLQRSEGVLLRYLNDAYKTLTQNVPEEDSSEQLGDIEGYLRSTLKVVDASLLEEWERLRDSKVLGLVLKPDDEAPKLASIDLAKNKKALAARVRSEAHRFVVLLARRDFEEAVEALAPSKPWTSEQLEAEVKPFLEAHGNPDTTPRARQPRLTLIQEEGERRFTVRHTLLGKEGDDSWMLEATIDLTGRTEPEEPLLELVRIGQ